MAINVLLLCIVLHTQLQRGSGNRITQYLEGDPMLKSPPKSATSASTIKSQSFRKSQKEQYPRFRKSYSNFRASSSILSLLDCIEPPEPPEKATAAPLLKSVVTATTVAPIFKSAFENPLDFAFETMRPTVMITFAPVQPVTMQPAVAGPSLDAPVFLDLDPPAIVKSSRTSASSSEKSSIRTSIKSTVRRRWNPWKRNTYYPRYRKSLLQKREPLSTLQPRSQYRGSRHFINYDTESPRRSPLSKSTMRKPPKGLMIRSSLAPINLKMRTLGPRATTHFFRPGTIAPVGRIIVTDAPVNPFPRYRRSGYFSVAPNARMITTEAPVPKITLMPVAAPTWAPFPRYRRSRACIALSNAPLSKNSHAPLFKGSWKSDTLQPQVIFKSNFVTMTNSPLIPIETTNSPIIAITTAPATPIFTGENDENTADAPTKAPSEPPIHPPSVTPIRIACLGDSLTRGVSGMWSNPGFDYPSQLQRLLGSPFVTYNYGRNAVTAIGGLSASYNSTDTFQASLDMEADIYLIMLGTNDAKYWSKDSHLYKPGMEWIIQKVARGPSTRIILAIPPWVKMTNFGVNDNILVNDVRPIILQVAKARQLQVVDMYAVTVRQNNFYTDDNFHLNAKGYEALAKEWKAVILCNYNDMCETGETYETCPRDCLTTAPLVGLALTEAESITISEGSQDIFAQSVHLANAIKFRKRRRRNLGGKR